MLYFKFTDLAGQTLYKRYSIDAEGNKVIEYKTGAVNYYIYKQSNFTDRLKADLKLMPEVWQELNYWSDEDWDMIEGPSRKFNVYTGQFK